ncbi:MAG: tRNA (guanosine(37)-N1)-methyltransferase TrmD [Actinobacteria bacterium]|nr:tRNA (guanosine(37)-N1)-methyltransferase TrmD [Actinomycetota bacterium]
MKIDVITIFPQYLAPLRLSLVGKAIENQKLSLDVHDLRDHTTDLHRTVDDTPYGGGPGMVMMPEPWGATLDELLNNDSILIIPTPSGVKFDQEMAEQLASKPHLVFACGRYEGIDARVAQYYEKKVTVLEVSIGDYVLAGGEVAAIVMIEAIARLIPGVLGNWDSAVNDSFAETEHGRLLEGPVYTKPAVWRGLGVPEVLLSGNHAEIAKWQIAQAKQRTAIRRPDLTGE